MVWGDVLPHWLEGWFFPDFSTVQLLAMAFVLGNFFTATADDLDRMSSSRGFLKTWSIIVVIVLFVDILNLLWGGYDLLIDLLPFIVKWILLVVLCTLSHSRFGMIFKLATGDVLAIASAGALLAPLLLLFFFLVLKLVDLAEKPLLRKFGSGWAYPFMPVIFTSYSLMLVLGLWMSQNL